MILLLRHAEREPWTDPETGDDLRLLQSGIEHAKLLGNKLSEHMDSDLVFLCSYPSRCAETAMYMAMGYGLKKLRHIIVDQDKVLVDFWLPGKRDKVLITVEDPHFVEGMTAWRKGLLSDVYCYKEYVNRCESLIDKIYDQYCKKSKASLIVIAHDSTILPFSWCYVPDAFPDYAVPCLTGLKKQGKKWEKFELV